MGRRNDVNRLKSPHCKKRKTFQFPFRNVSKKAWNELRRYHPAVEDELEQLAEWGVKSIK